MGAVQDVGESHGHRLQSGETGASLGHVVAYAFGVPVIHAEEGPDPALVRGEDAGQALHRRADSECRDARSIVGQNLALVHAKSTKLLPALLHHVLHPAHQRHRAVELSHRFLAVRCHVA